MSDLTQTLQGLSPAKRALLEHRLKQKEAKAAGSISRRADRMRAPMSYPQQRLWFLQQLEPENPAYHVYAAVKLDGHLDVAVLEWSLAEIVRRHEVLRTRFVVEEGEAVQVITGEWRVEVSVLDLSGLTHEERESEAVRLAIEESRTPFDLAQGPLFRARQLRLGEEENVLLLTMHHIVSDGWSVGVLVRELAALYEAYASGKDSPLGELRIQYGDFAAWQREHLQGEVLERQLGYWRQQLSGELPVLELPTDHPRPPLRSHRGAQYRFRVSDELTEKLKELSRREGTTLFMTLLAVFDVLLARYTGQEDLLVGTPIAGRTGVDTEESIGFFVNTLVLRTDVSGNPTVRELISRVKWTAVEAYAHQEVPFERLVEELQPKRDLSRTALFQVMFVLQNLPTTDVATLPGLRLKGIDYDRGLSKFDLSLTLGETENGLEGMLEYNTDLFERDTMERMATYWVHLLEQVGEDAGRRLWELELMEEAERRQVVEEWNRTEADYPRDKSIVDLITEQVARTPDQIAIVFEDQRLTYAELDARADQLSRWLASIGVGDGSLVGVCAHRSMEMVIALLGIFKAGAAYVPFAPDLSPQRLEFLLQDTQASLVITQAALKSVLSPFNVRTLSLDTEWVQVEQAARLGTVERAKPAAQDAAYVIFTSGSTGQPKGVVNTHAALCNRLWWMQQRYVLGEEDVVLQKTPYTFDVSVWEFFWPLMAGATLVVASPDGHHDSQYLTDTIAEHRVTTVHFVPSMLASFLNDAAVDQCRSVRRIICSGEELTIETQYRVFQQMPWAELHNLYGPTEAAIDVTSWRCRPESGARAVPIGRPISNVKIYILDQHQNPVPIGVAGELHIGGVALARGYLNRPELTSQKFIQNPFARAERLYRSGDWARYRRDGVIEYGGRLDFQLKLRGCRIEPGEIEFHLRRHAAVRDAVVLAGERAGSDKQLVAYVVPCPQSSVQAAELRSWLKPCVPDYMMPAVFVVIDELPLNTNGKIDRRLLPEPESAHAEGEYIEPRTEMERAIAAIWSEVLRVERVGAGDNFFSLGGHSLMATQVISRVRQSLNIEVPLAAIFQAPTVAEFASVTAEQQQSAASAVQAGRQNLRPTQRAQAARRLSSVHAPSRDEFPQNRAVSGGNNE